MEVGEGQMHGGKVGKKAQRVGKRGREKRFLLNSGTRGLDAVAFPSFVDCGLVRLARTQGGEPC